MKRGRPTKPQAEDIKVKSSNSGLTTITYYDYVPDEPATKWTMVCKNLSNETVTYYFDKSKSASGPYKVEFDSPMVYEEKPKKSTTGKRGRPPKSATGKKRGRPPKK